MRIDPKVEKATRDAFNLAVKRRLEEIPQKLGELGDDAGLRRAVELCMLVAGYVAVDVCGMEKPTQADLYKIADNMIKVTESFEFDEEKLKAYLTRVVFGPDALLQVLEDQRDATYVPLFTAASMIVTFCPKGQNPWQYLDAIEQATEMATELPSFALPAAVYQGTRASVKS